MTTPIPFESTSPLGRAWSHWQQCAAAAHQAQFDAHRLDKLVTAIARELNFGAPSAVDRAALERQLLELVVARGAATEVAMERVEEAKAAQAAFEELQLEHEALAAHLAEAQALAGAPGGAIVALIASLTQPQREVTE
jgi:hypothetical protein